MIPQSLLDAHRCLQIDERGIIKMVRIAGYHATGAYHCTSLWGEYMPTVKGGVVGYTAREFFGDQVFYKFSEDIGSDPVVIALPEPGTQVWQWTPNGIWRTSRIKRYSSAITPGPWSYHAILEPAGPMAGVPVGGDSGSICWVFIANKWQVLGVVSHASGVIVSRPRKVPASWAVNPIELPAGTDEANPFREASIAQLTAPWVNEDGSVAPTPTPDTEVIAKHPLLIQPPDSCVDAVGQYVPAPDGKADQIVDVAWSGDPNSLRSIVVKGEGGDEWRWPDTGNWWHIRAQQLPGKLRLWMAQLQPTKHVRVELVRTDSVGAAMTCQVIGPTTPEPTPQPTHPTNSEVESLRKRVAELETELKNNQGLLDEEREHLNDLILEVEPLRALKARLIDAANIIGLGGKP